MIPEQNHRVLGVTAAVLVAALALVAGLIVVPCAFRFPVGTFYAVVAYAAFDQHTFRYWTVVELGGLNVKPSDIGIALLTIALLHAILSTRLDQARLSRLLVYP